MKTRSRSVVSAAVAIILSAGAAWAADGDVFAGAPQVDKQKLARLADAGAAAGQESRRYCPTTVDLRSGFPPVRHQGDFQWCYAYAAADLLSYRDGRAISAVDLAMLYNEKIYGTDAPQTTRERGWTGPALNLAFERQVCLEEEVPSQQMTAGVNRLLDTYKEIERLADEAMRVYGSVTGSFGNADLYFKRDDAAPALPPYEGAVCESPEIRGTRPGRIGHDDFVNAAANAACFQGFAAASAAFPRLTRRALFEALRSRSKNTLLRALTDASCRRTPVRNATAASVILPDGGEQSFATVAAQLNARNPVGIAYNPDALKADAPPNSQHASVLAGLRWNGQTCEILVRDSYGQAELWIPAARLMHAVSYIQYLAP